MTPLHFVVNMHSNLRPTSGKGTFARHNLFVSACSVSPVYAHNHHSQEAAGVDLVVSGHSHGYERTWALNGHYGTAATLKPCHVVNGTSAGPYMKPLGFAPNQGAVYVQWCFVWDCTVVALEPMQL